MSSRGRNNTWIAITRWAQSKWLVFGPDDRTSDSSTIQWMPESNKIRIARVISCQWARGTGEFSSTHHQTDIISYLALITIRYTEIANELAIRLARWVKTTTLDNTYLRRERVYDMGSQRFGKLEKQNDRELEPWQRGWLFLSSILLQEGCFLVNFSH